MRGTVGQQRADRAFYIQWGSSAMQVAKAKFKGAFILWRWAQAFPPSRFKHYGGYAIVAPLGH